MTTDFSERNVVDFLLEGDSTCAEKYLYDKSLPLIKKYILSNNGTIEDAEDVFHDSIIVLIHNLRNNVKITSELSTYLYSIAKNLWLRRLAAKRRYYHSKNIISYYAEDSAPEQVQYAVINIGKILLDECEKIVGRDGMNILKNSDSRNRRKKYELKKKIRRQMENDEAYKKLLDYLDNN